MSEADAEREPRTLRATPTVSGPEGSFEVLQRCALCGDVFTPPAPSDPLNEYDEALAEALADGGPVIDPECFVEARWRQGHCGAEKKAATTTCPTRCHTPAGRARA
jgi:hypothetical protein